MARIRYYDPDTQEWLLADAGGDENVQSDWEQANTTADDYIKNKPVFATVATTGSYSDLNGKPTYAVVASTGRYEDLIGKPDNDVYITLTESDMRSGTWKTNERARSNSTARITTIKMYPVSAGDKIVYKTGVLSVAFSMYIGKTTTLTSLVSSGTVSTTTTYRIPYDGYLVAILTKDGSSAVAVSDYDADITIINSVPPVRKEIDKINEYMLDGYMSVVADDMVSGQWNSRTHQANPKRIHNENLIPVNIGDKIIYKTGDLLLHVGVYQEGATSLTNLLNFVTATEPTEYIFNIAGVLALTLKDPEETDIDVTDYDAEIQIINDSANRRKKYQYYGEKIQLNGFDSTALVTLSSSHGNPNDIAVYGNYVISGTANGYLHIYNLATGEMDGSIQITEGTHFNNLVFSNTKADANDVFPLLYAETENTGDKGLYLVIRIPTLSTYSISKKYRFDEETYGLNPQIYWDFDNNIAYGICIKPAGASAKYDFYKFDLSNETQNADSTYTPAVLLQGEIGNPRTRQGGMFYKGRIYLMTSNSSSPFKSEVLVINCNSVYPDVVTRMPNLPFTIEGEGLSIAEDANRTPTMYISSTQKVYKLSF